MPQMTRFEKYHFLVEVTFKKSSACVLKHVTQGLKSEFWKNLRKKIDFDAKVTFGYFCIHS